MTVKKNIRQSSFDRETIKAMGAYLRRLWLEKQRTIRPMTKLMVETFDGYFKLRQAS